MHFCKLFELKCVCTQPSYNDTNPPSVFLIYYNLYPFLKSSRFLCDVTRTEAPPTIVWLTGAFQHRLHWCLSSDPSWVSRHQSFHRHSRCRQEWLRSDWGVLLFDVIMNIAVVIYTRHLSAVEDYVLFWRECALYLPKCV